MRTKRSDLRLRTQIITPVTDSMAISSPNTVTRILCAKTTTASRLKTGSEKGLGVLGSRGLGVKGENGAHCGVIELWRQPRVQFVAPRDNGSRQPCNKQKHSDE